MDLIRSSNPKEVQQNKLASIDLTANQTPMRNVQSINDVAPGIFETAGSFWQNETLIGSVTLSAKEWGHGDVDPTFNVFRHWLDNKDDLSDMESYIRQGKFDSVVNLDHFNKRVNRFRTELENRDNMANGSGFGNLLGMGLSLVDVMTFVPVLGQVRKGKSALTALDYATKTGAVVGAQELAMHQMQEFRTAEESAFNIAAASVLLSAIGGYKGYKANGGTTISQGVKAANQTIRESSKTVSEKVSAAMPKGKTVETPVDDSVGAAKVADGTASVMDGNRGAVAKGLNKATRWIDNTTPVGRSFSWSVDVAREATQKLMDTGGRISKGIAKGQSTENAETVKNAIKSEYESLHLRSENLVRELNLALSGTGPVAQQLKADGTRMVNWAKNAAGKEEDFEMGLLSNRDFNELVVRMLHEYADDADMAKLTDQWGRDRAKLIIDAAQQMVNDITVSNRHLEDMMLEQGLITESQRLGDGYKMAQLWNSRAISEDHHIARDFFLRVLQDTPAEEFVEDFGLTMEQFNKLGLEDVEIKTDEGTQVITTGEGAEIKRSILEEWAGDTYERTLAQAEIDAEAALAAEKSARQEMVKAAALVRSGATKVKNLSIKRARELVKESQAKIELKRAERNKAKSELEEAQAELKRDMFEEYEQMMTLVDRAPQSRIVAQKRRQLEQLTKQSDDPLAQDPVAIKQAQEELIEAEINFAIAADDSFRSIKVNTPAMAKYKEKANAARRAIRKSEEAIENASGKVFKLREAIDETEAAIKGTRALTKDARAAYKALRNNWLKSRKDAKGSKKAVRVAKNAKNMVETIDDLIDGMKHSAKSPQGVLTESMFEGGRSKSRTIRLTPEQTKEAHELGILKKDLYEVLDKQWDEVSARLALKRVFGKDVKLDLSDVKKDIEQRYNDEADFQRKRNKKSSHILTERDAVLKDIDGLLERLYGRANMPDDPESVLYWATGKAREYNFTRFGPEFIITSFTDIANMVLTNGFGVYSGRFFRESSRILKEAPDDVVHKIATASEQLLNNARHLKLAGSDGFNDGMGIGVRGTRKQKITSSIDRASSGLNEKVNVISFLGAWNMKQKAMTMILQQDALVDIVKNPSKLTDLERAKLASLGVGPDQMALYNKMAKEFGTSENGRVKSFEAERWMTRNEDQYRAARADYEKTKQDFKAGDVDEDALDAAKERMDAEYALYSEGRDAYHSFVGVMRRAADRGIMTPGIGDTPLVMDNYMVKMLTQFQTYGFVIMNKMIAPAIQRAHHYQDVEAIASLGMALGLGGMVTIAKDLIRNGEVKDRDTSQWVRDVVDRSGMLAWISPYVAGIEKATGLGVGGSRFEANNVVGQLLGPSMGLATDLTSGINALSDPEQEAGDKLRRLAPYQALYKIYDLTTGE